MTCSVTRQLNDHLLVNIRILRPLVSTNVKPVLQNYLEVKLSFIQVAAGPRSTRQLLMMLLNLLSIARSSREFGQRSDVHPAVHTLAMFLRAKGMTFRQIKDGVSIQSR